METQGIHKIRIFHKRYKRMPSYAELAKLLGYSSKNAAYKYVEKLINGGYLSKDKTGKLLPMYLEDSVKVLGVIEAGFPSPAEEELVDTMSLDDYLIGNRDATYILRVQGDSMKDAGINEGDMVIVERTSDAQNGDIVIAEVDGAWTMKYFEKKGRLIRLIPGNKRYKPIEPKEDLKISARVTAVIRKYK